MNEISNEMARNFLVNYQNLNGYGNLEGREGVVEYMSRVRCIQFDPLNVVGRNPDLVLQSRVKNYHSNILFELLYDERTLIDGMDKVLSILLCEDYLNMTRIRKATVDELKGVFAYRGSLEALELLDEVKNVIRKKGPQPANKISIGSRANNGKWGHKKLSSAALEYLYHSGQLAIYTKINTQKVYELSENVMPVALLNGKDPFLTEQEFLRWYVKRRIGSIGLVWNKNTGAWVGQYIQNQNSRTNIIHELVEKGEILAFRIEKSKEIYYIRKEDECYLERNADNNIVQFIAPLDNFIWDRGMIEELFEFKYSWEVYTPIKKRKYGYYVLPVLYKNRFIARFEPEQNRGNEPLRIRNWWWEPEVIVTEDMIEAIKDAFYRFSMYLEIEMMEDKEWKNKLNL